MKQKKPLRPIWKRALSMTLAGVMTLGTFAGLAPKTKATQVPGEAPFINTWLVSGPFDKPVADILYNCQEPADGEITGEILEILKAEATSVLANSDSTPDKAYDGDHETAWKSDTRQGEHWDDNGIALTLNVKKNERVTGVVVTPFERDGKMVKVTCTVLDRAGNVLEGPKIRTAASGEELKITIKDAPRAATVKVAIGDMGDAPNHLGISEIAVFGEPAADTGDEKPEKPESGNWAEIASVGASSCWKERDANNKVPDYPNGVDAANNVAERP